MAAHNVVFDDRKSMTAEEYLRSSFEPDAELVDGRLEERPMGEIGHGRWQDAILAWFRGNPGWDLRALPEVRVQVSAESFRVPDITVLLRDQLGGRIVTEAPVAVIEVLSPEDRRPDLLIKLREYGAMGIRNIFVVDPESLSYSVFREGVLRPVRSVETLEGLGDSVGAVVDWGEIEKLF